MNTPKTFTMTSLNAKLVLVTGHEVGGWGNESLLRKNPCLKILENILVKMNLVVFNYDGKVSLNVEWLVMERPL